MGACFVIVNSVATLEPSQSTAELLLQLLDRGISVGLVDADAVETRPDGSVWARARRACPTPDTRRLVDALRETTTEPVDLMQAGLVWVRVNPGRGPATAHALLLEQLAHLEDSGVTVLNSPRGLLMARSKLYLSRLPAATRPRTLVTRSAASAREFVESLAGPAVLKPVIGTRGRDVFLVSGAIDPNFRQIFDVIARAGPVMVQAFIAEASDGDTRVLLVDGRLIERAGAAAIVRRVPSGSDFRSNVHVGGRPAPGVLTPGIRALVDAVGPRLREDGLFLVGLDVIGGVVVEANVFAAGGFSDIETFTGVDFLGDVVEAALGRAGMS